MNITPEQWQEIVDRAYECRGDNFLEAIRRQLNSYYPTKAKRAPVVLHISNDPYRIRATVDGVEVENISDISIDVRPGQSTQATIQTLVLTKQNIALG